jgi:hypothetical protein
MGNYYALELFSGDERQIFFSEKGLPPAEFLTVFRPCDRAYPEFTSGFEDSDEPYIPSLAYVLSVPRLTERLEVMGFTVPRLEENLERCLKTNRAELDRRIAAYEEEEMSLLSYYRKLKRQRKTLEHLTLRRWVNSMRTFRTREGLSPFLIPKGTTGLTALQRHMLNKDDEYEWYYFGLPVSDLRHLLRAIMLCADEHEEVLLDLSEIEGDYFEEGDEPVRDAIAETIRVGRVCEKILVLTEGRTDTRILSKSLAVLYPHLADLYSFLDYEAFNLGGGTGNLASLVKGLAGVGIGNRVIALFDNDSAGAVQANEVRKLNLPDNFRILTLPDLKFAKRYPTVGPNGTLRTDINGCACGIELYLGTAALTGEDGLLTPVQWGGYEAKVKRYQGELTDKKGVEERFLKSLDGPDLPNEDNLASMRAVLQMMFTAFA